MHAAAGARTECTQQRRFTRVKGFLVSMLSQHFSQHYVETECCGLQLLCNGFSVFLSASTLHLPYNLLERTCRQEMTCLMCTSRRKHNQFRVKTQEITIQGRLMSHQVVSWPATKKRPITVRAYI